MAYSLFGVARAVTITLDRTTVTAGISALRRVRLNIEVNS